MIGLFKHLKPQNFIKSLAKCKLLKQYSLLKKNNFKKLYKFLKVSKKKINNLWQEHQIIFLFYILFKKIFKMLKNMQT